VTEQQHADVAEPNPFMELVHAIETMSLEELRTALKEFLDSQGDAEARPIGADVPERQGWSSASRQAIHDSLALEIAALSTPAMMWSHGMVLFGTQLLTRGIARQILDPGAAAEAFDHVGQILEILRTETGVPR